MSHWRRPGLRSLDSHSHTRVTVEGEILATTALAALFTDGDTKAWVPFSMASFDPPEVGPSEATMPEWMAIEKGFA